MARLPGVPFSNSVQIDDQRFSAAAHSFYCVPRQIMADSARSDRQQAVSDLKRALILRAARRVFETEGLEGASVRSIAREAGYTAGAIYFHFDSKEAVYGAL